MSYDSLLLRAETFPFRTFAGIAVYGWYNWVRGAKDTEVKRNEILLGLAAVAAATIGIAVILTHGTDSEVPWPDASVLATSLLATYGQAKKVFQHWYVWIAIELVSIPLYFSRGLNLTAILYIGFTALCVYGLVDAARTAYRVSGTLCRDDLTAAWRNIVKPA